MLSLGRRQGERVIVFLPSGEKIVIEVLQVVNLNLVRLGFDAPKEIIIKREEMCATSLPVK